MDIEDNHDLCLTSLIHRGGKWVTNGILKGFGYGFEELASSFNTAAQILVIGRMTEAMRDAVNRVLEITGGLSPLIRDGLYMNCRCLLEESCRINP
ncbi:MAG: hypothetical protein JXA35_02140 [Deltaproteobacteria bacterium]|nr:hypothetical protein [Deltaproteobacteria bacterium]